MVALPANASEIKARESLAFHRALTDWPGAVGSEVSLRVLNLDIADIWSAVLVPGRAPGGPTGFVADGPGTLSARTFYWNGVEYTVDRLAVGASERGPGLQFATTPDLPEGLRLTVPERSDAGGRFRYPVHVYPLDRATRSAATGVDFEWPGARTAWARVGNTEPVSVYLTTPPRAQHVQRELWAATLTPGRAATATDAEPVLGYWPADELPPTEDPVTGAPGTLTPVAAQIDGVAYTVDALAMVSEADLWLRTTPPLPKGRGLVLELEVAGGVLPLSVDAAELPDYGYRWPDPFGGALSSGWDADSDDDGTLDPRRVRLVRWGTSGGVRASVSPPSAPEGGGTARVSVTATLDGAPVAADLPVTVTIGAADDTATEGDDYTASATHTLTVPAGAHSASVDVEIAVVNDSVPEPLEEISVSVEAEGRASAATAFAIEDDDHVTIEYWAAALTGAKIEFGGRAVDGYLADPQTLAPLGGELAPLRLRCCRGRQSDEPMRTVRALGRHGDDFVFAMTNLVRDGALAPEFAGAVLRVGARPLSLDRARVVELAQGAPALAWDAHLVDAPPGATHDRAPDRTRPPGARRGRGALVAARRSRGRPEIRPRRGDPDRAALRRASDGHGRPDPRGRRRQRRSDGGVQPRIGHPRDRVRLRGGAGRCGPGRHRRRPHRRRGDSRPPRSPRPPPAPRPSTATSTRRPRPATRWTAAWRRRHGRWRYTTPSWARAAGWRL